MLTRLVNTPAHIFLLFRDLQLLGILYSPHAQPNDRHGGEDISAAGAGGGGRATSGRFLHTGRRPGRV
jgi:hypothetical protein